MTAERGRDPQAPLGATDPLPRARRGRSAERALLIRIARSHLPRDPAPLFLEVGAQELVLGRGAADEVETGRASLDDNCLSRDHARIVPLLGGDRVAAEDLRSTNGSWLAGERLASARTLRHGDVLEIGQTFFRFWRGRVADLDALVTQAAKPAGLRSYSPDLLADLEKAARVAASEVPLVLHGESGTGKEVMAREVHRLSGRRGPYRALNCAAIPEGLIESELFGHRKGAFTGAGADKAGVIEASHGGTLLLDEIGDMPLAAQAKLLRVLQERRVVRVGGVDPIEVDVRFLAATHQDLPRLVDTDRFRGDLYARINGLTLSLPPLRARKEDIGLLLAHFLGRLADGGSAPAVSHDALRALIAYDWPYNIRELGKAVEVACALAGAGGSIEIEHLPEAVRSAPVTGRGAQTTRGPDPEPQARPPRPQGDELRAALERALTAQAGNVSAVARELQTTRTQIHRWMKRFGIDPDAYRDG